MSAPTLSGSAADTGSAPAPAPATTALRITHPYYDLNEIASPVAKKRVVFADCDANPHGEVGRAGIRYHGGLGKATHKTITVRAKSAEDPERERTFYLNKKSLINWINACSEEAHKVTKETPDAELVERINGVSRGLMPRNRTFIGENESELASKARRFKSARWGAWSKVSRSARLLHMMRFAKGLRATEKRLRGASEARAVGAARRAYKQVKAYRKLVGANLPVHFNELPVTSRESYLKPRLAGSRKDILTLYCDGKIPTGSTRELSGDADGRVSTWRGRAELKSIERLERYVRREFVGNKPYSFVNALPCAEGTMATLEAVKDSKATVSIAGPNPGEILQTIVEAHTLRPKDPIVVVGHPADLKAVVVQAQEEGVDLHKMNAIAILEGAFISEADRDDMLKNVKEEEAVHTGFTKCYTNYGAVDLDLSIGMESDFSIWLRRECVKNDELRQRLFPEGGLPQGFHYDPLNTFIETGDNQELIFTMVRQDRISPRIRYDLGDRGSLMYVSDVLVELKTMGIELPVEPKTNLPLLFVRQRHSTPALPAESPDKGKEPAPAVVPVEMIDAEVAGPVGEPEGEVVAAEVVEPEREVVAATVVEPETPAAPGSDPTASESGEAGKALPGTVEES